MCGRWGDFLGYGDRAGIVGVNDKSTFDNMSMQKNDIQFHFVWYVESAFGGEAVESAENALVNTISRQVDQNYAYTIDNDVVPVDDDEIDDEDGNGDGNCDVEVGENYSDFDESIDM